MLCYLDSEASGVADWPLGISCFEEAPFTSQVFMNSRRAGLELPNAWQLMLLRHKCDYALSSEHMH